MEPHIIQPGWPTIYLTYSPAMPPFFQTIFKFGLATKPLVSRSTAGKCIKKVKR